MKDELLNLVTWLLVVVPANCEYKKWIKDLNVEKYYINNNDEDFKLILLNFKTRTKLKSVISKMTQKLAKYCTIYKLLNGYRLSPKQIEQL